MSPFQEEIHERLQKASEKIDSVMELDDAFQDELADIEEDMTKAAEQKARYPGRAIANMLTKWADEPVYTAEEIQHHAKELWISLE